MISEWLNRITVYNKAVLYDAVEKRRKDQALVTISNHRCCFDDPVLWGTFSIFLNANASQSVVSRDSLLSLILVLKTYDVFVSELLVISLGAFKSCLIAVGE